MRGISAVLACLVFAMALACGASAATCAGSGGQTVALLPGRNCVETLAIVQPSGLRGATVEPSGPEDVGPIFCVDGMSRVVQLPGGESCHQHGWVRAAQLGAGERRCFDSSGTVTVSRESSCVTAGLFDGDPTVGPASAPSAPTSSGSGVGGPVYVHGYTRANGTYVAPYTRRR